MKKIAENKFSNMESFKVCLNNYELELFLKNMIVFIFKFEIKCKISIFIRLSFLNIRSNDLNVVRLVNWHSGSFLQISRGRRSSISFFNPSNMKSLTTSHLIIYITGIIKLYFSTL